MVDWYQSLSGYEGGLGEFTRLTMSRYQKFIFSDFM